MKKIRHIEGTNILLTLWVIGAKNIKGLMTFFTLTMAKYVISNCFLNFYMVDLILWQSSVKEEALKKDIWIKDGQNVYKEDLDALYSYNTHIVSSKGQTTVDTGLEISQRKSQMNLSFAIFFLHGICLSTLLISVMLVACPLNPFAFIWLPLIKTSNKINKVVETFNKNSFSFDSRAQRISFIFFPPP